MQPSPPSATTKNAGTSSRLDGLINLLQSGTYPGVRKLAASQIGELVVAHPTEAIHVLKRIRRLLWDTSWDARVAAGYAISSISEQTPIYVPKVDLNKEDQEALVDADKYLRFESLEISNLLNFGAVLLASSGEMYKENESIDVIHQREQLKMDLGISDEFGGEDMLGVKDEDLVMNVNTQDILKEEEKKKQGQLVVDEMVGLSSRERNRLKREAKKRKKGELADESQFLSDSTKKTKIVGAEQDAPKAEQVKAEDVEAGFGEEIETGWIFANTCEILKKSLFNVKWEIRHGAAIGLREIMKKHAKSAGRFTVKNYELENQSWLVDLACRLVCVLALDRFGDFVGDGVVAPVRETAAMAIGAVVKVLQSEHAYELVKIQLSLLSTDCKPQWEVRHAALLGIKYILAVREDLGSSLIPKTLPAVSAGLNDDDDDVRAVAAESLVPITQRLTKEHPETIPDLVKILWDLLPELDDISASTPSVLKLIGNFSKIRPPQNIPPLWLAEDNLDDDEPSDDPLYITEYIQRIWRFMRHNAVQVRRETISVLDAVVEGTEGDLLLSWLCNLCDDVLQRLYRNILLEADTKTLGISKHVFKKILPVLGNAHVGSNQIVSTISSNISKWIKMSCHETRTAAIAYDKSMNEGAPKQPRKPKKVKGQQQKKATFRITEESEVTVEGPDDGNKMQLEGAMVIGELAKFAGTSDVNPITAAVLTELRSQYSLNRRIGYFIAYFWVKDTNYLLPENLIQLIENEIDGNGDCPFAEIGISSSSFFSDVVSLCKTFTETYGENELLGAAATLTLGQLKTIAETTLNAVKMKNFSVAAIRAIEIQTPATLLASDFFQRWKDTRHSQGRIEAVEAIRMRVLVASGFIATRKEALEITLTLSATAAMTFMRTRPLPQKVAPYIKNLMNGIRFLDSPSLQNLAATSLACLVYRLAERESTKPMALILKNLTKILSTLTTQEQETSLSGPERVQLQGVILSIKAITEIFGENLFSMYSAFWNAISESLVTDSASNSDKVSSMVLLRTSISSMNSKMHGAVLQLLQNIIDLCISDDPAVATQAQKCHAEIVFVIPGPGMNTVVTKLVPMLDTDRTLAYRIGASRALQNLVNRMGLSLIPYISFLIVPTMSRMVDQNTEVRNASAEVFGTLVRLIPLEEGVEDDVQMNDDLLQERENVREFLGQLLGTRPRTKYELPIPIGDGVELRQYQQDCLDWLGFLNRYGLHGALCDDMGLGKTLMTLCIIAGDSYNLRHKLRAEGKGDSFVPSLVIAPPTVVAHWYHEAHRFFPSYLTPVIMYAGNPKERARIRDTYSFEKCNLLVTSYDTVSHDLEYLKDIQWNYLALDEGHVVKNVRTKTSQAVRFLQANHRLVLSGTPIQNSVTELWSIFDFLMPGFLGSEKSFKANFAKPIMQSRDPKCNDKDREKGMISMESLHRQVLPFVLRRLKDDVLDELPPKIIQDYYCTLSPLQDRLYEDFSENIINQNTEKGGELAVKKSGHIFQALRYLQRLCSHPKLVLTPKHPEYQSITRSLQTSGKSLDDLEMCPKLMALRDILSELGIGDTEMNTFQSGGGHRALIFAQMKDMLDLVETDLFAKHMPDVTSLRLDGTIEATKRHAVVTRFNSDPSIDCLLLTTHVGGLGLNLTGADTVIFLEHDWNPTKDLQAMDRAHRLGQKRTVNVYRLITKGTLEEKIMGIQKFKTHIANTVINKENSSLQSMDTSQLLNLFKLEGGTDESVKTSRDHSDIVHGGGKVKQVLENLGELWGEEQYQEEYSVEGFLNNMNKST